MITIAHDSGESNAKKGRLVKKLALSWVILTISPYLPGSTSVGSASPGGYIRNFYQLALMFGGVLAFGAIVYGGIRRVMSAGNPSAQSEANQWIQSALLGLLLLVSAYLILFIVNPSLVNLSLPSLGGH